MTISSETRKAGPTPGNGVATVFPFAFKVFAAGDLSVVLNTLATGVQQTLVLNDAAGYTVALNVDQNANPGGSVIYNPGGVPMPATQTLTIGSVVTRTQGTHLINGGAFLAQNVEDMVDRAVIGLQQMAEKVDRSVRFPIVDPVLLSELPAAIQRVGKYLSFDASGNVVVSSGTGNDAALRADLAASGGAALIGFIQNSVNAFLRSLQDKNREVISVMDFLSPTQRADALARTYLVDMTAAYQKCLDYVAPGGKVIQPRAGYLISDTLNPQNGITIAGDNWGDNNTASKIKFTGANRPCFKLGTSDGVLNYGNSLRDMYIELTQQDGVGVKLNATCAAELWNIAVEGAIANLGTRTTKAFDIDGRNISGFFATLRNCRALHIHTGFHLHTTGGVGVTENMLWNCVANGDKTAGDATSIGFFFENAGESTTLYGGNMEDCGTGCRQDGLTNTAAFSWFGPRFENNTTDLQLNATGAQGHVVILGTSTLDPAKTNDNSLHKRNVIQYGYAGQVSVSNLPVTAGFTRINNTGDYDVQLTMSGPVANQTRQVHFHEDSKGVTMTFPDFHSAANGVSAVMTIGGLPADLWPANDIYVPCARVTDNGADLANPGMLRITAAGGMTMFATVAAANFNVAAGVLNTGWYGFTVSWRKA